MKLRTSAIALAVAGIVAAPMAAQADVGAYASARVGLVNYTDDAGGDSMAIGSHASRFGMAGEADLGNGSTGYGKYELGYGDGGVSERHLYAGVKGSFGDVRLIDSGYTTFYNNVVSAIDTPWWNSGSGTLYGISRNANALNYEGGSGGVAFGIAIIADGSTDGPSATEVSASFDAGPVKIGVGVISADATPAAAFATQAAANAAFNADEEAAVAAFTAMDLSESVTGFSVKGSAGDIGWGVLLEMGTTVSGVAGDAGSDVTGIEATVSFGDAYVQYGQKDYDDYDYVTSGLTLGYTQTLGKQTSAWYEYASYDTDGVNDSNQIHAVLKFDWK